MSEPTKYWKNTETSWEYILKEDDPNYIDKSKKSELNHCHTNIAAFIYRKNRGFILGIGGVGGSFYFECLEDAKKFVEKYYEHKVK
jgi:hypothetical protein